MMMMIDIKEKVKLAGSDIFGDVPFRFGAHGRSVTQNRGEPPCDSSERIIIVITCRLDSTVFVHPHKTTTLRE